MAKFQETFSGNSNGTFPSGWTARNTVGGAIQDWAVRDDGSALDGKILKYNDASSASSGIRHIIWDAPGSVADCNILMKIKGLSTSIPVWLVARAADADNLYGGLRSSASGSPLALKRLAGSQSTVASGTQPDTYASGIYYKYRLDISGSDVRFKLWRASDSEPASYQAANPDTDITAANPLGLWAFNTQQAEIDWITAGTGGDVADDLDAAVVTSLDTIPATAFPGETITLGVTGAGATQGTGGVTINGETQTISSWSDASIDITVVQGDTPYGTGNTVTLTTDGGDTDTGTIELVADTASGVGFVDMSSPNTSDESSVAFGATPTVVTGDQFEWEDLNTLGNLVIDAEGFVESVDTEGTFRGRFWDATDSTWGAVETFTASLPAVASSRGLKRALKVQSLKRSLRKAI